MLHQEWLSVPTFQSEVHFQAIDQLVHGGSQDLTSAELNVAQKRLEKWSTARSDLCTQVQDYTVPVLVLCLIPRVGLLSPPR